MDKLEIRMDRGTLDTVIDALAAAAVHARSDAERAELDRIGSWLSHRYTVRWGLPRRAAAALAAARGGRGGEDVSSRRP